MQWIQFVVVICLAAIGGVFILCAVVGFFLRIFLAAWGRRTFGRVVGYEDQRIEFVDESDESGVGPVAGTLHVPIVKFCDETGNYHEIRIAGSRKKKYRIGDMVPVVYSDKEADDCYADTFADEWGGVIVAFLIGTILVLAAAFATRS